MKFHDYSRTHLAHHPYLEFVLGLSLEVELASHMNDASLHVDSEKVVLVLGDTVPHGVLEVGICKVGAHTAHSAVVVFWYCELHRGK